ncbi:GrpB family protein [Myxococcota bacterium]|nr:GrpB family protein [Myxococcota bacterium]
MATGIRGALGAAAVRIDHIGSTAVPGLDAKPVIDVQISVVAFDPIELYRAPLVGLGYVFRAENPERTKRYFREGVGQRRTHIHVRRAGSWSEQLSLLFRDYLRAHADEARRYAALKHHLAEVHRTDRAAYAEAKEAFIWEILRSADRWSQGCGWAPGPTDL